ncbi:MAG TPA: hypothetical protein VN616_03135 [Puia sp.]|nr:hypothetical protein [Puia sp.]
MKKLALLFFLVADIHRIQAQPDLPGPHAPADTPAIFAPGVISTGLSTRDLAISPSGDEIYYTIQQPKFISSTLIRVRKLHGIWGRPEVVPFSGVYRDLEPCLSWDGNSLYFSSDRPVSKTGGKHGFDIWVVRRNGSGQWGQPENLGEKVNSEKDEFYPSIAKNGNLYFTVEAAYGKGSEDIVRCRWTDTGYTRPESLPEQINTAFDEFNAFIDPDEQYILFSCEGRPGETGKGDLYISRKDAAGNWQNARLLPAPVNSGSLDYCPYVSRDKRILFFTSNRLRKEWYGEQPVTYDELRHLLSDPGNGYDSVYWITFDPAW